MTKENTVKKIKEMTEDIFFRRALVDKWINELRDHGYSYEDMKRVFDMAGKKLDKLNNLL